MDIKVGDKVLYTGSSENDLTHGRVYPVLYADYEWVEVIDNVGEANAFSVHKCEPVTDAPQYNPDYNNGEWWGWNGGECPVHPESVVDYVWHDPHQNTAGLGSGRQAVERGFRLAWGNVVKFRVTKPYVEPKKPREVWLLIEDEYITDATFDGTDASKHGYVRAVLDD